MVVCFGWVSGAPRDPCVVPEASCFLVVSCVVVVCFGVPVQRQGIALVFSVCRWCFFRFRVGGCVLHSEKSLYLRVPLLAE